MSSGCENNNPMLIPLDTEANITSAAPQTADDNNKDDNQECEVQIRTDNKQLSNSEENPEFPSPISTDSTTSPSQGASSTQESLSELGAEHRQASLEVTETEISNNKLPENSSNLSVEINKDNAADDSQHIADSSKQCDNSAGDVNTSASPSTNQRSDNTANKYVTQHLGTDVKSDIENLVAQAEEMRASQALSTVNSEKAQPSSSRQINLDQIDTVPTNCDTATTTCGAGTSGGEDATDSVDKDVYHVKWIEFGLRNCAIITQNENGPCPLISIVNVLLLRGRLSLPPETEMVSAQQLLEYLGDMVLSQASPDNKDLDLQRNLNDAVAVLNRLATGLDVNVKFTGVSHFEFTPEMLIFDILNIDLFHGWLVDPQAEDVAMAVNGYSYNQLVETIISNRISGDSELLSQSLLAAHFLEESASQLTYHGLYELTSKLQDQCLAVFFRNNHFSTIFKKNGELFLLVTDQGYLNQSDVVWETLANIEGDCHFVNHLFQTSGVDERLQGKDLPQDSLERDRYLAETLQREGDAASQRESLFQEFKNKHFGGCMTDEELAKRLQEVENRAAQEMEARDSNQEQGAPRPQNPIGPRSSKKSKDCAIL